MFKVETNKMNKMIYCFIGILCAVLFVLMIVFYNDMNAYFSQTNMKVLVPIGYIVCMIVMLIGIFSSFDTVNRYLMVERKELRIKHLFRKEIIVTPDQIVKWKCFTQYLRTGATSENIIIYYSKSGKIEFSSNECTNFEKLLNHLDANYKGLKV